MNKITKSASVTLPLNTSETHSLNGLSTDRWGALKASLEEGGNNRRQIKKEEENNEKRNVYNNITRSLKTSGDESFSLVLDE